MVVIQTTSPNISTIHSLSIESVRGFPDSWTDQGLFNAVAVKFIGARKRLG